MKKQKRIVPNVVRGGVAIPLGANYFLMKGKTHEQGGIDIGKDLEVENGELIKLDKNNMTIISNAPIMNGISPAEYALGGLKDGTFVDRFKQGFKYQEKYKDINRLKDDGTKAGYGRKKKLIGGDKNEIDTSVPLLTREEYIKQQRQSIINKSLENSNNRRLPTVPYIPRESKEQWYNRITSTINDFEEAIRNGKDEFDEETLNFYIQTVNSLKKELNDGYGNTTLCAGDSCIYTATDNYGKKYRVSGNQSFRANPAKYGFEEINLNDIKPGDIIQDFSIEDNIPHHAITFIGYDNDNKALFNYSKGGSTEKDIVKNGYYPFYLDDEVGMVHFDGKNNNKFRHMAAAYRFIGTEDDNKLWNEIYNKERYNQAKQVVEELKQVPTIKLPNKVTSMKKYGGKQNKLQIKNGLKYDKTKAKIGKEKTIDEMNSKMLYVPKKEPEVIINPPFLEGQVYKEIKDYIGGSPTQARKKAFNKMPRIKEKIIELANTYGVDKNLLAHRLTKEGWIDKRIQEYNKTGSLKQRDFWDKAILREVNAFEDLGLDDAATNLAKGNYNMRNELPFWTIDADNEKGRKVYSIVANSLFDALEFQAADMEYRKNELLKRGYPEENINTYINAAYNLGLYHKDLDDAEWINKTYTVPNYYELGGKANMKKNDRNVPSTGKKIKASLGIELNKVKNRINTPENNRVIKITPELKLLTPEPLKPTSEQKRNLAIAKTKDFIKNNIDGIGDFTNALVGVGSSIASNRINNKMLNNLEELPEITPFVPLGNTKLKTSYNIHPQLAKARKIANRLNRYVDRNTSSSQTAINRRRQNELDYLENVNTLYGQKENVETQLINQDRMLQHQIDQYNNQLTNQDIARQDTRKAENIQLRNTIAEKKAENSVALADNISSIINNMIMNRKQGRANDKTLRVMAAGFPSITKDYLKELGLV